MNDFRVFDGVSLVYMFDNPYVNILEQSKV